MEGVGELGEAAVGLGGEPADVAADAEVRALGDDLHAARHLGGTAQRGEELLPEGMVDDVAGGVREHEAADPVLLLDADADLVLAHG